MKLFAIVDSMGHVHAVNPDCEGDAWGMVARDREHADYLRDQAVMRCIELHTYDPSKQGVYDKEKQVVVDSAVCAAARDVLKARVSEYEGCLPTRFQEKEIHAAQELDKFLKAGEMKS